MNEMMAYCGLNCQTCPIYLATRLDDAKEQARVRADIARMCREQYGMMHEPGDIMDCDGCQTEGGRLFKACQSCPIRGCARQKGVENCAFCAAYACEKLEAFFKSDPDARVRLDQVRGKRKA